MKNKVFRVGNLLISTKKLVLTFVLLTMGTAMIMYGVFGFYADKIRYSKTITDEEIIERAKALGMIDLKEYLKQNE